MIFLGDQFDRGYYTVSACIFLFSLKINYSEEVTQLKGNHESVAIAKHFTFRYEVKLNQGGDESVFDVFIDAFDSIPRAAAV